MRTRGSTLRVFTVRDSGECRIQPDSKGHIRVDSVEAVKTSCGLYFQLNSKAFIWVKTIQMFHSRESTRSTTVLDQSPTDATLHYVPLEDVCPPPTRPLPYVLCIRYNLPHTRLAITANFHTFQQGKPKLHRFTGFQPHSTAP